jgi:hypothetical protein
MFQGTFFIVVEMPTHCKGLYGTTEGTAIIVSTASLLLSTVPPVALRVQLVH